MVLSRDWHWLYGAFSDAILGEEAAMTPSLNPFSQQIDNRNITHVASTIGDLPHHKEIKHYDKEFC